MTSDKETYNPDARGFENEILDHSIERMAAVLEKDPIFRGGGRDELTAALQVVAHREGLGTEIQPLRSARELTGLERLYQLCRQHGLRYRQVQLTGKWWLSQGSTLLGFRKSDKRPVVLESSGKNRYQLVDPTTGKRTSINASIAEEIFPMAFSIYRGMLPKISSWQDFWDQCLRGSEKDLKLLLTIGVLMAVLSWFMPIANKTLFDRVIPARDTSLLGQVMLGLLVMTLSTLVFTISQSSILLRLQGWMENRFHAALWDKLLRVPMSFYRRFAAGDLIQRAGIVNALRQQVTGNALRVLIAGVFSIFNLAAMLYYSPKLTVVGVGIVLASLIVTIIGAWRMVPIIRKSLEIGGQLSEFLVQMVNAVKKIRVATAEKRVFAYWAKYFASAEGLSFKAAGIGMAVSAVTTLISSSGMIIIYFIIIRQLETSIADNEPPITLGTLLAFTSAYGPFSQAISNVAQTIIDTIRLYPSWQRAKVIIDAEEEPSPRDKVAPELVGEVEVDNVFFRYDDDSPWVLHNVSMHIKPGEFIGIVGKSGSGKSTLVRLLMGFEYPQRGTVSFDRCEVGEVNMEGLRQQLGVVMQTSSIFPGTLYENIVCGRSFTMEEMQQAITASASDEVLAKMPMGLETPMTSGGGTLSGGEAQRIYIARALLKNPKVLIFDEATSALDNVTQEKVSDALKRLDSTRIAIAHRLNTVRHADRIYVLEQGEVVQTGAFDELLDTPGPFKTLWRSQQL